MTVQQVPQLWLHGTSLARARKILVEGFKLPSRPSYVGKAICLTPDATQAYEYGAHEDRGVVLECRIRTDAVCTPPPKDYGKIPTTDMAEHCQKQCSDWTNAWGGMAIVANPAVIEDIRILPLPEVLRRMVAEFEENGPNLAYNGRVADYAELWHFEKTPIHPYDLKIQANLMRHTDYKARLEAHQFQPA